MGRYYRHAVAPIIDYSYKLPFQELFKAMQMKEQQQQQAISSLQQSESQTNQAFQAASGLKYDNEIRDKKMTEFNDYISKMSTQDLTKMENINDINNYVKGFGRDKDVLAITKRKQDYDAKNQLLADSRKKHGVTFESEKYWFNDSIRRYNEGDGYMRELDLGSVQGHYDYMKDLTDIGKMVKPDVTSRLGEDGKYYYTVKNTNVSRAKLESAIASAMPEGARQALKNDFYVQRDKAQRAGTLEEQPYLNDFYDFVKVKAAGAATPFVQHQQEYTGRGILPEYTQGLKDKAGAAQMIQMKAPPIKVADGSISKSLNDRRKAAADLKAIQGQLAKTGFGQQKLDINDPKAIEEYLIQNPNEGEMLMTYKQQIDQLSGVVNNENSILNQTNNAFIQSDQGKDYWNNQYNKIKTFHKMENNEFTWQDKDGKERKATINSGEDLMNFMVNGKANVEDEYDWYDEINPFSSNFWMGTTRQAASAVAGPDTFTKRIPKTSHGEYMLQELLANVTTELQDYAENEDITSNLNLLAGPKDSAIGQQQEMVHKILQEGQGQFFSANDATPLRDLIQDQKVKWDDVRKRTEVNLTDGVGKNGLPMVWITAYNKDGTKKIVDQAFEMQTQDASLTNFLADQSIAAGLAKNNPAFVRSGETMKARHLKDSLRGTNLYDTIGNAKLIQNSPTRDEREIQYIQRGVPGHPNLALKATALTGSLVYTLMQPVPNQEGEWMPVKHREINEQGELLSSDQVDTRLSPELKSVSATNMAALSWMWWKYKPENHGERAIFDPVTNRFKYLPAE